MTHDVSAQAAILLQGHTDLGFGADAVGRGNQDGLFIFRCVEFEEAAKEADVREDRGVEGFFDQTFDALNGFVAFFDINAGVFVTDLAQRKASKGGEISCLS
jgi:hypothetical protein